MERGITEKTRKLHLAQEAKRILNEPLLKGFYEKQNMECLEAFKRLPMGAKLEEYQTVHHDLLANERLMVALRNYIQEYDNMIEMEKRNENEVEGI